MDGEAASLSFLAGGGKMGELIRSMDWSRTPLGPPEAWPQSLRTTLNLCLASNFPLCFIWGPQRVQIYNDGYWPICAAKHPHAMGQDYRECWYSAWPVIGPGFERCVAAGETTFLTDTRMFLDRSGFLEETFFTFSFSPIRDGTGQVAGVFHPVTETTHLVLAERRLRVLRDLADRAADARTIDAALALAAAVLGDHPLDLPFALLYRLDAGGPQARRAGVAGLPPGSAAAPEWVDLEAPGPPGWPLAEVARSGRAAGVEAVEQRFGDLACGPYPESPRAARVFPIFLAGGERPTAILVAEVSPRRGLDESYRAFYDMLAVAVTTAVANAHAYEEEKRRAEILAELDRAKTAFFSNVSHEFRTPLTLMLGPLEELLNRPDEALPPAEREQLTLVHRNGLRLLKLVNTLLDFSRLEAGRAQAAYEPVDLAVLTAELAALFRSAVERAGLRLRVDCPPLPEPVYVDREMWEKVVLNLLSNAFKFTLAGEIAVAVRGAGEHVEVEVRDTGAGIPAEELPHVFERFHRVKGAVGRSYEGSGIGLSLVQELVRLHGGTIRVDSRVGEGTTFTAQIPTGAGHLPADRIHAPRDGSLVSTAVQAEAFVEEALRWLPGDEVRGQGSGVRGREGQSQNLPYGAPSLAPDPSPLTPGAERPRVLLADDNADMRDYVRHLLSGHYEVVAVANGRAALAAVRERRPDLVLTDVMMPHLDGFGLLSALRADPPTRTLPVILLSARAGEEARIEGLSAGADDYLVKPFPARELLARIEANLKLARLRQEVERAAGREEALREADRRKDEFLAMLAHELRNPLSPVVTAARVLRKQSPGDPLLQRQCEVIERQVRDMSRLLDELLEASRLTRGLVTLQKEPADLHRILRQAVESTRSFVEECGHELSLCLPPAPVRLAADRLRLEQVVMNLVHNAAQYTEPGGRITVSLASEGAAAVIRVRDTGIGMSPELLPGVFDLFVQGERDLDRRQGGLGVGLTIVKRLVELHGGRVEAKSDGKNRGSELLVRLPLASDT